MVRLLKYEGRIFLFTPAVNIATQGFKVHVADGKENDMEQDDGEAILAAAPLLCYRPSDL